MERYPTEWKEAAYHVLKAMREKLQASLGYKRVGWEPICNLIMAQHGDAGIGQGLIRQNLESWELNGKISDEKFSFIDYYFRVLGADGSDAEIAKMVRQWRFEKITDALSSMYIQKSEHATENNRSFRPLPWTIYFEPGEGRWFNSMFIRGIGISRGITQLIVGYLPKQLSETRLQDGPDTIFYEGWLIPVGALSDAHRASARLAAIKLSRPEYRGLGDIGLADGYLDYVPYAELQTDFGPNNDVFLYPSSSVLMPARTPLQLNIYNKTYELYSEKAENVDIIIEDMIADNFSGYVY